LQKKIKKLIIILLVIFVILVVTIFIIANKLYNSEDKELLSEIEEARDIFEEYQKNPAKFFNGEKLQEIKAEGLYFTLEGIIEKYNNYLVEENKEAVYNVVYDEYKKQNNLSKENILQKMEKYSNYKISQVVGASISQYGIYYAKIEVAGTQKYLMINWDIENDTFSISPIDEAYYNKGINSGIEVDSERIASIEENSYNKIDIKSVDNDDIAKKYFYGYIEMMLHNTKEAYELLDEQYKELSFPKYNDFVEYINYNKTLFESLDHNNLKTREDFENYKEYQNYYYKTTRNKMKDYAQTSKDGIKTYVFEDSYGKYYIFTVTSAMKYTVMLDNYVIPTEDFTETYNSSTEQEKVVLNIKKFFMGIDDKNYGYSYDLFADSFKNNKYSTKESFVNYAKQNFFEENEIEYIECKEQNGVYIYKIRLTDASGASAKQKEFNMIVKLNSGTDFEMSFGEN